MPLDGPEVFSDGCHELRIVSAMFGRVCKAPTASMITLASLKRSSSARLMLMLVSLAISSPVDVSICVYLSTVSFPSDNKGVPTLTDKSL